MKRKNQKLNRVIFLCTISILILIVSGIFTNQSHLGLKDHDNKIEDENFKEESPDPLLSQLPEDAGGENADG